MITIILRSEATAMLARRGWGKPGADAVSMATDAASKCTNAASPGATQDRDLRSARAERAQ